MDNPLEEYYQEEKRQENLEHRDVLLAIGSIIKTATGKKLFSYLFKSLDVAQLPDPNLEGNMLYENLGVLRAGSSIYKLACEADSEVAASILSKLERERYDKLCEQYRIEHGIDTTDTD